MQCQVVPVDSNGTKLVFAKCPRKTCNINLKFKTDKQDGLVELKCPKCSIEYYCYMAYEAPSEVDSESIDITKMFLLE